MTQEEIRNNIKKIVLGSLRYADPNDSICKKYGQEGYTIQSAEEVLDDIIHDLKSLQKELQIESSLQSAVTEYYEFQ